jgi:DNA-binding MarR family transcriptional regulator
MDIFAHRSMRDWVRFVKTSGLSMPQFGVMMRLHYHGQCGLTDLSEHMEITNAAASQLVDKLVQSGLLERAEDPNDRRAKQLTLTAKGRKLIEAGIQERYRWVEELAVNLSAAEREKVSEALETLTHAARQLEEAGRQKTSAN